MRIPTRLLLIFLAVALLTSCAVGIQGAAASVAPLESNNYSVLARGVSVQECSWLLLGAGEVVRVDVAAQRLARNFEGDALINVRWAQQSPDLLAWLASVLTAGILQRNCAVVSGDVIRYSR